MSSLGNKDVMSKNLRYYIDKSGKTRQELSEIWGFPYSTVSEWVNGRKYPRIDRIEIMADYFGILKSDLIEDRSKDESEFPGSSPELSEFLSLFRKLTPEEKKMLIAQMRGLTAGR